jgi:hypothetical protein
MQQLVEFANIDAHKTCSQFFLKQISINLNLYNIIWLIKENVQNEHSCYNVFDTFFFML